MVYFKGYDLSESQGTLTTQHWEMMAKDGCKFVIVECGIGNDGISSSYHTYMSGAKSVNIIAVPYHFVYILPTSSAHPNRDPESQAVLHYSYCQSNACIDVEWPTSDKWAEFGIPSGSAGAAFIRDWVMRYLAKYEQLCGGEPWVYTYPSFAGQIDFPAEIANYPLWIASYEPSPAAIAPWGNAWSCWQQNGGTNGVKLPNGAPVDTDVVMSMDVFNTLLSPSPTSLPTSFTPVITPLVEPVSAPWVTPTPEPDVVPAPAIVATSGGWQVFASFFAWLFNKG